ncbi:MAG: Helix-turn-helix domain [Pseudomonadota bacterium]|jgi:transcriptional regulator with XRE-family HTH domain
MNDSHPNPDALSRDQSLGQAFTGARIARGMTREDVAKLCGMSANQIDGIESGEYGSFYSLASARRAQARYADALGMEIDSDALRHSPDPVSDEHEDPFESVEAREARWVLPVKGRANSLDLSMESQSSRSDPRHNGLIQIIGMLLVVLVTIAVLVYVTSPAYLHH